MKPKNNKDTVIVPSVDIILALLNNDPRNDLDFLEFYDGYIHAAATEPVYTAEGNRTGCFINEDLVQEIRIEFLKSLSPLRLRRRPVNAATDTWFAGISVMWSLDNFVHPLHKVAR